MEWSNEYNPTHQPRLQGRIRLTVFYRAGIIEQWGTGTLNIIDWCRENSNPEPEWTVAESAVSLTLKPVVREQDEEARVESGVESGVESEMALKVLNYLEGGDLSKKEIALKLGKAKPTRYLNDMMRDLVQRGVVQFTIPDKPQSRFQKYSLTDKGRALLRKESK
ncbi:MAG: Fic family protein [Desulfurivibrionaceae bacterium]